MFDYAARALPILLRGLILLALFGWLLYRYLSAARAVWHGDESRIPAYRDQPGFLNRRRVSR
jgi:hypothetical protein